MDWLQITVIALAVVAALAFIVAAQWQAVQQSLVLVMSLSTFGTAILAMLVLIILRGEGCL